MRRILALSVLIMFLCSACVELGDDYPGGPRTLARQNREIQTAMAERQKRIDEENRQKNAKVDARRKRVAEFKEERQEKFKIMEAELKDQYLSEYLKNDRFQYVVTSVNYDEIINTLVAKAKLNPQIDSSKYSLITKDDMSLVHNIYLDLSNAISVIDNIINIAASKDQEFQSSKPTLIGIDDDFPEKKECMNRIMTDYENSVREGKVLSAFEERTKFFSEVLVTCGLKDSEKQQTLKSSGIYGEITSERNRVYNLRSEIYQDAYRREFSVFLKMTGFSFYSSGVNFTLSDSLNNPKWVPEPDLIYSLQNMQAMQTIDGGILMVSRYPWGDSHIVFLDTTINFVDGKSLDGFYANYIGNHKYQSISGTRNVYSFKLFPYKRNQLVNGTQFYFYPNVILQQ